MATVVAKATGKTTERREGAGEAVFSEFAEIAFEFGNRGLEGGASMFTDVTSAIGKGTEPPLSL